VPVQDSAVVDRLQSLARPLSPDHYAPLAAISHLLQHAAGCAIAKAAEPKRQHIEARLLLDERAALPASPRPARSLAQFEPGAPPPDRRAPSRSGSGQHRHVVPRPARSSSSRPRACVSCAVGPDHSAPLAAVARLLQVLAAVARLLQVLAAGRPIAKASEQTRQHVQHAVLRAEARLPLGERAAPERGYCRERRHGIDLRRRLPSLHRSSPNGAFSA
jgi:hypothetical protein